MISLTGQIELGKETFTLSGTTDARKSVYIEYLSPLLVSSYEVESTTSTNYEFGISNGVMYGVTLYSASSGAEVSITFVLNYTPIIINQRNLLSLEFSEFDRGDTKTASFGIHSNSGTVSFNDDRWGTVLNGANYGKLQQGLKVQFFINNTLIKKSELVGEYKTKQWDYDSDKRTATLSFGDELTEWQDIETDGLVFNPNAVSSTGLYSTSLLTIYKKFAQIASSFGYDIVLDDNTRIQLQNIFVKFPYISPCSLWKFGTKICQASACHIYQSKGKIIFRYNGGN